MSTAKQAAAPPADWTSVPIRPRVWRWVMIGVVAGLLVGSIIGYAAGVGTSQPEADSVEVSKQIVDEWLTAVAAEDPAGIAALYAEDAVWLDEALGERFTGRSGVQTGWSIFSIDGFEISGLEAVAITRDRAVTRWTIGASRRPMGGSPTPWEVTGLSVLDIVDGQIAAETVYYDSEDVIP